MTIHSYIARGRGGGGGGIRGVPLFSRENVTCVLPICRPFFGQKILVYDFFLYLESSVVNIYSDDFYKAGYTQIFCLVNDTFTMIA